MSARIDAVPAPTGRDWPKALALAALVVAFGVVAGPVGALAGVATALVGYLLGTPYALAAGHVALVAAVPDGIDPLSFLVAEVALVALLVAPVSRTATPGRVGVVAVASALALASVAWLVVGSRSVAAAAAAVLVVLALAAYGRHRLELVRLGLVPGDEGAGRTRGPDAEPTTDSDAETTAEPTTDSHTDT